MTTPRLVVPGLYELTLPIPLGSVNVFFILTADGVTLIDTGFPDRGAGVLAGLSTLGRAPEMVQHIIVTHHHVDHAGNLATLQECTGATVWMHPLDAEMVSAGQGLRATAHSNAGWLNRLGWQIGKLALPKRFPPARVDRCVEDGAIIPIAGGLEVIHIPGHSVGQIALRWSAQQTLFVADAVMHLGQKLRPPLMIEDAAASAASITRLDRLHFTTLCFGHGPALTEAAASAFHRYAALCAAA